MQESLVVEAGMMVTFLLVRFATCILPLQLLLKVLFTKKKLNNNIVEIHKDPTS